MHVRSQAHAQARSGTHVNAYARSGTRSSTLKHTHTNCVCAAALYDEEEEVTKTPYENYA